MPDPCEKRRVQSLSHTPKPHARLPHLPPSWRDAHALLSNKPLMVVIVTTWAQLFLWSAGVFIFINLFLLIFHSLVSAGCSVLHYDLELLKKLSQKEGTQGNDKEMSSCAISGKSRWTGMCRTVTLPQNSFVSAWMVTSFLLAKCLCTHPWQVKDH